VPSSTSLDQPEMRRQVLLHVVRDTGLLAATGIVLGIGLALALTRLTASFISVLLYKVTLTDPTTYAFVDTCHSPRVRLNPTAERFNLTVERLNLTVERLNLTVVNLNLTRVRLDLTRVRLNLTVERLSLTAVNEVALQRGLLGPRARESLHAPAVCCSVWFGRSCDPESRTEVHCCQLGGERHHEQEPDTHRHPGREQDGEVDHGVREPDNPSRPHAERPPPPPRDPPTGEEHERDTGDDAAIRPGNLNVIVVVLRVVARVDDVAVGNHVQDASGDIRHEHQDGHTHQQRDTTNGHGKTSAANGV